MSNLKVRKDLEEEAREDYYIYVKRPKDQFINKSIDTLNLSKPK